MYRILAALLLTFSLPAHAEEELSGMAILQARQARAIQQPQQALAIMQQAYSQQPGDPKIIMNLGYALIAAGQAREAVSLYDMLIAMQPENPMAYNGKAIAFDYTGNHYAAQELYDKALALESDSAIIQNNLAMSYILDDQPQKAIALLKPIAQKPDVPAALRQNLALAYGLAGDETNALAMNLKDLPEKEAAENLKFYAFYKKQRAELRSDEEISRALLSPPSKPKTVAKTEAKTPMPTPEATSIANKKLPPAKTAPSEENPAALAPAAGAKLPKGYKPSPSAVDSLAQEPEEKEESKTFLGFSSTPNYPGQ